jgi:hypothetical protein
MKMTGFWRRMVDTFDTITARLEADALAIERDTLRLAEETAHIERGTEQMRRETNRIRRATKDMFNDAVADLGMAIEQATTHEERDLYRGLALELYQSLTPAHRR